MWSSIVVLFIDKCCDMALAFAYGRRDRYREVRIFMRMICDVFVIIAYL
jgi:hypothetical protein